MTQWVKVFVVKHSDPSSISRAHMVAEENKLPQEENLSSDYHTFTKAHCPHP